MDEEGKESADTISVISGSTSLPPKEIEEQYKIQHGSEMKNAENAETSAKITAATPPDCFPPKLLEEQSEIEKERHVSQDVSYWNIMYVLVILGGCTLATSVVTLLPRHNTIYYPEFWYEPIILFVFTIALRLTIATIVEFYIFTNVPELLSKKVFLKLFLAYSISFILPYCICYATWTVYLGRNHPLPFIGQCGIGVYLAYFFAVWHLFRLNTSMQDEEKKKITYFIFYRGCWFMLGIQFMILRIVIKLAHSIEWITAILIPIVRSFNSWIISKIVEKIVGTNNEAANCLVATTITMNFTFFVAIQLFSSSQSTVYCILGVELALHMRTCYQIIQLSRKVGEEPVTVEKEKIAEEKKKKMFELVISELMEAMIPLLYGVGYATAYYGPNGSLIKNVRSNYFGGKVMSDIQQFYIVMLQLFSIDLITMILSAICLYHFCHLGLFQEMCKMIKKYWWMMLLQLSLMAYYFETNDINYAQDYTGKFIWTTHEGRFNLIMNANDLSDEEKSRLLLNTTIN